MNRTIKISFALIVVSVIAVSFIYFTNNHLECETVTQTRIGDDGEKIVVEKHVCKEKYNL